MKRTWMIVLPLLLLALTLGDKGRVLADSGGYTLLRGTTATNAVGVSQNRDYQLRGTLGQPVAQLSVSGTIAMGAGYWYQPGDGPSSSTRKRIYMPLVNR